MIPKIHSMTSNGLRSHKVEIEAALHNGIPSFQIVGLGDTTVHESKERIRSSIKQSGFEFPRKKIAINLAPANVHKSGPMFDLPISIAILNSSGVIQKVSSKTLFLGELNLNGELKRIQGILPLIIEAQKQGFTKAIIPPSNVSEARLIKGITIQSAKTLKNIIEHLIDDKEIDSYTHFIPSTEDIKYEYDFCDIKGQTVSKRALEIAAAGGHNVLFTGSPGCGKTLLSKSFPSILPPLSFEECIEASKLHSISGLLSQKEPLLKRRPFRSPHHTASHISIIGGGRIPRPGEISLAHLGVLFLDEIAEFPSATLEALRQPLEDGSVHITRVGGSMSFPASFILLATMNPCPCGYAMDDTKECLCSNFQIERYQKKLSGPFLDRIDMHLEVPKVEVLDLQKIKKAEASRVVKKRVIQARSIQKDRFSQKEYTINKDIPSKDMLAFCDLEIDAKDILKKASDAFGLSARSYFRLLKVARTIADLGQSESIQKEHIEEALQYRIKT